PPQGRQIEKAYAAVIGVEPALDPAGGLQPVELVDQRDRLDFKDVRKRALVDALVARQMRHDRPLRPGQADGAGAPVEPLAQEARDIVQQEAEAAFGIIAAHKERISYMLLMIS